MEDRNPVLSLQLKEVAQQDPRLPEHFRNLLILSFPHGPVLQYLTPDWNTYYFMQEPDYYLLTGVAKAIKESETVSGITALQHSVHGFRLNLPKNS